MIIYLLLIMVILLQRPPILLNDDSSFKSWNYFLYKLNYGYNEIGELICLPTIIIICSISSFIIAKNIE